MDILAIIGEVISYLVYLSGGIWWALLYVVLIWAAYKSYKLWKIFDRQAKIKKLRKLERVVQDFNHWKQVHKALVAGRKSK